MFAERFIQKLKAEVDLNRREAKDAHKDRARLERHRLILEAVS